MSYDRVFSMKFKDLYPHYVLKATKKNRSKQEVDEIIFWLLGYDEESLNMILNSDLDVRAFFENAPGLNKNSSLIKGVVCGIRVEEIEDPLIKKVRYLDKLIDELAKGRTLDKILRKES